MLLCSASNVNLTKIEGWNTDETFSRWCHNCLIIVFHTYGGRSRDTTVIPTGGNPSAQDLPRCPRRFRSELNRGRFSYGNVSP